MKITVYPCPHCGGYGIVANPYSGDPDDCRKCDNGWFTAPARDKLGRFQKGEPQEEHPF